jgi:hypothetical protein
MVKLEVPLIVLTGGPGAGKTAVLEILSRVVCRHIAILPEAASILFGGGFWRNQEEAGKRAAQRAIFHVQRELENVALADGRFRAVVCDRGTLDGMAYWPGDSESFMKELSINRDEELKRYSQVIHVRTPTEERWYNHRNPLRIESVEEASELDRKVELAWVGHPNRHFIQNHTDFVNKAQNAILLLLNALPKCCEQKNRLKVG